MASASNKKTAEDFCDFPSVYLWLFVNSWGNPENEKVNRSINFLNLFDFYVLPYEFFGKIFVEHI